MNRLMSMRSNSSLVSAQNYVPPKPNNNNNNDDNDEKQEDKHEDENNGLVWMEDDSSISNITLTVSSLSDSVKEDDADEREGTLMSARMNLLTSMVGGGSLSLPLAYHQMGNICMAPLTMIIIVCCMECSVRCLIISGQITMGGGAPSTKKGNVTLEQVACAAFGPTAKYGTMALVFSICFFTLVGYGVLLRDLLQPLTDLFHGNISGNLVMSMVVLLVTPLTTLSSLTALRNVGAASMGSVLIMTICISYRSLQCTSTHSDIWKDSLTFAPHSLEDVLQSFPILLSVFVCHFNVLSVHNELRNPTPARVNNLIRSTYASSVLFYIALGILGSLYASCTPLQSNVLKSFSDDDSIILVGRICLTFTIALAYPMLVVPARNVLLSTSTLSSSKSYSQEKDELEEELLPSLEEEESNTSDGKWKRILAAVFITWLATAMACCVSSIAVVWDFLGSSLSILLAFVLPCGSYLKLSSPKEESQKNLRISAWIIVFLSVPIMVIGTSNAFYTTFFKKHHT